MASKNKRAKVTILIILKSEDTTNGVDVGKGVIMLTKQRTSAGRNGKTFVNAIE